MLLKVKLLKWDAGRPVIILNRKTAEKLNLHLTDRISIKKIKKNKQINAVLDIIAGLIDEDEIAVSSEIQKYLNLKTNELVDVSLMIEGYTEELIKKKLDGKILTEKEIKTIIKDIVNNSLSEAEISYFVSGMYKHGMTMKETIYLIKAIVDTGNTLKLNKKIIADKHSIGGVAANRTTPLIVSIIAASGLTIPKNSSRAITSAAGTVDVIETIAKVNFSAKQVKKIVNKTNACMVWGGALGFAPADSKIIQIERLIGIDPEAQLLASIISKKLAAGSNHIIIDIPYGNSAKVNRKKALELKKKFEYLGKHFKLKLKCVLTDGKQPIGNGIGPVLEMIDVLKVLKREKDRPLDLEKKSIFLAGKIFELTGKVKKGSGESLAFEILNSGKAFKKFEQIIKAQKGKIRKLKPGKFLKNIKAKKSGKIISINNKKINNLARVLGCPTDKKAGVYLYSLVGNKVKKSTNLLTIYAESKDRLKQAIEFYRKQKPIKIK